MKSHFIESAVYQVLGQQSPMAWDESFEKSEDEFIEFCQSNSLQPLFCHFMKGTHEWRSWPHKVRTNFTKIAGAESLIEDLHREELQKILKGLFSENIQNILMKGSALSELIYPKRGLRPRCDTDIFIRQQDRAKVDQVMRELGYDLDKSMQGEFIGNQCCYVKSGIAGTQSFEFHWKILNPRIFSELLKFEEVLQESVAVEPLHQQARAFSLKHSLLLSCIHKIAHHPNEENLIWFYDIHLLIQDKDQSWLTEFEELVKRKGVFAICVECIFKTHQWFGTRIPDDVFKKWEREAPQFKKIEFSAKYIRENRSRFYDFLLELRVLNWKEKIGLCSEYLFPSKEYMFFKFGNQSHHKLPLFYVLRILKGLKRTIVHRI